MRRKIVRTSSRSKNLATLKGEHRAQVDNIAHDGRGVARINGVACFIHDLLPGEAADLDVTDVKGRHLEAKVVKRINESADRIKPSCEAYGTCGGCDFQHIEPEAGLALKQDMVLAQVERMANTAPEEIQPSLIGKSLNYRRSARIGVNQLQRDDSLVIGFRRRGSNKLVNLENCPVLAEELQPVIPGLREALALEPKVKAITQVDAVFGDTGGALVLRQKAKLSDATYTALTDTFSPLGFTVFIDDGNQTTPLTPVNSDITTNSELTTELTSERTQDKSTENLFSYRLNNPSCDESCAESDLRLAFTPSDFIQVNAQLNQQLIHQAIQWLAPQKHEKVLDLFCGLGNFSLPMATLADSVVGVEGSKDMVERATANALSNQLTNCTFAKANLFDNFAHATWLKQDYDLIILDPPRAGAAETLEYLSELSPRGILYIACNPSSLARDTQKLIEMGYKMSKFCVADMFPQTIHVESMAFFEPTKKTLAKKAKSDKKKAKEAK